MTKVSSTRGEVSAAYLCPDTKIVVSVIPRLYKQQCNFVYSKLCRKLPRISLHAFSSLRRPSAVLPSGILEEISFSIVCKGSVTFFLYTACNLFKADNSIGLAKLLCIIE